MNSWTIYTDGSCRGTKVGGIGVIWVKDNKKVSEYSRRFENTTNNQMELIAIYIALKSIKKQIDNLTIISDSEYALGCIFNESWNPKKNKELILKIKEQVKKTQELVINPIQIKHIYGHQSGNDVHAKWNNFADKLATNASS